MNNRKFTRYVLCASIFTAATFLTVSCAGRNSDAPSSMDETPIVSSETQVNLMRQAYLRFPKIQLSRIMTLKLHLKKLPLRKPLMRLSRRPNQSSIFLLRAVSMTTDLLLNFAVL